MSKYTTGELASGVCPNNFPFGWNTHLCDFQLFSPGQGHRIPQAQRSAV